jgi:hypothetical protein
MFQSEHCLNKTSRSNFFPIVFQHRESVIFAEQGRTRDTIAVTDRA